MPLPPDRLDHLLRSQVREIQRMLDAAPQVSAKLAWKRCDADFTGFVDYYCPCIGNEETRYYFVFGHVELGALDEVGGRSRGSAAGEHWIQFSPGEDGPRETQRELQWNEVLYYFDRWLSLVARELEVQYVPSVPLPTTIAAAAARRSRAGPPGAGSVARPLETPPLTMPQVVTIAWLREHVPAAFWVWLVGVVVVVFGAGIAVGTTSFVLELRGKSIPQLERRLAEQEAASVALRDSLDQLRLLIQRTAEDTASQISVPDTIR